MSSHFPSHPFATKNLITLPELDLNEPGTWHGFTFDTNPKSKLLSLAEIESVKLPKLYTDVLNLSLEDTPLPDLDSSTQESIIVSDGEESAHDTEKKHTPDEEDVWKLTDTYKARTENKLVSWDHFLNDDYEEPQTAYISEAGTAAFDALLRKLAPKQDERNVTRFAKRDILFNALFDVGLGRSSAFFTWNDKSGKFDQAFNSYTITGLSEDSVELIVEKFLKYGAQFRQLEKAGQCRTKDGSTKIALGGAILSSLYALEEYIERGRCEVNSLIQIQERYHNPGILLNLLHQLVQASSQASSDDQFLAAVYSAVEELVLEEQRFEIVLSHVVSRVAQPCLEQMSKQIGLLHGEDKDEDYPKVLSSAVLPAPVLSIINSARSSLQALRESGKPSVLLNATVSNSNGLDLYHSWDAIVDLQKRADAYEDNMKSGILTHEHSTNTSTSRTTTGKEDPVTTDLSHGNPFTLSSDMFGDTVSVPVSTNVSEGDLLRDAVLSALQDDVVYATALDISSRQALELSLRPFLTAQHRLLSYSVLRLLFEDHDLTTHFTILYRFQLFGDGVFALRLSTALFDSEQTSGEGKRRTNMSTGLRLQSRNTWPPASSELRLVLMGLLSESMTDLQPSTLSETISFAIRDLTDEELDRCRNLNSIHALDFLRLQYKTSNTMLDSVITSRSLSQHDRIFNHLLRLLRMKSLAQNLLRRACVRSVGGDRVPPFEHKFRIMIQHFIFTLADYSHNVAIHTPWLHFSLRISSINDHLKRNEYDDTLSLVQSLDHLKSMHDEMLNDMMTSLLLKRKQERARKMLEDIFDLILRYSALSNTQSHDENDDESTKTIPQIHRDFKTQVKNFIQVLKAMKLDHEQKQSDFVDVKESGFHVIEQLYVRLEFNGFYS